MLRRLFIVGLVLSGLFAGLIALMPSLAPETQILAYGTVDDDLYIADLQRNVVMPFGIYTTGFVFWSHDNERFVMQRPYSREIYAVDAKTREQRIIPIPADPTSSNGLAIVAWSPNDDFVAFYSGGLCLLDWNRGSISCNNLGEYMRQIEWLSDGIHLLVQGKPNISASREDYILLFNRVTQRTELIYQGVISINFVLSPDGTHIAFATGTYLAVPQTRRVMILELKTGQIHEIMGGNDIYRLNWSPNSQMIAINSQQEVWVFDLQGSRLYRGNFEQPIRLAYWTNSNDLNLVTMRRYDPKMILYASILNNPHVMEYSTAGFGIDFSSDQTLFALRTYSAEISVISMEQEQFDHNALFSFPAPNPNLIGEQLYTHLHWLYP